MCRLLFTHAEAIPREVALTQPSGESIDKGKRNFHLLTDVTTPGCPSPALTCTWCCGAARRSVLCAVWLWRGCCTLYAELRTARYWEPSGCRYSAESRSPPIAGRLEVLLLSDPRLTRSSPALLAVSPDTSPGTPFLWKFLRNYVFTRWAGIIQETDNLSINLIKVFIYISIQVSPWLLTLFISLVFCIRNA